VISQLGGTYVRVSAILSNPNTDPHTFESSASVTQEVSGAQLVVQNGGGYDSFMNKIEAAAPSSARRPRQRYQFAAGAFPLVIGWLWSDPARRGQPPACRTDERPIMCALVGRVTADVMALWGLRGYGSRENLGSG